MSDIGDGDGCAAVPNAADGQNRITADEVSVSARYHSATLALVLHRAKLLAPFGARLGIEHVLAAIIELVPDRPCRATKMHPACQLLWDSGIRWDRATRIMLGVPLPEERAEAAERAELARLKAKYEGGAL